ncbi:hypothetical protein FDECE_7887 [Fusarium decemcellulare]|nr:hypothetical protein FDECE_7887 [Fusarium decemcellulare]
MDENGNKETLLYALPIVELGQQHADRGAEETVTNLKRPIYPFGMRRAKQICQHCRAKKIRCDVGILGRPCTNCRRRTSDCVLAPKPLKRKRTPIPIAPAAKDHPDLECAVAYSKPLVADVSDSPAETNLPLPLKDIEIILESQWSSNFDLESDKCAEFTGAFFNSQNLQTIHDDSTEKTMNDLLDPKLTPETLQDGAVADSSIQSYDINNLQYNDAPPNAMNRIPQENNTYKGSYQKRQVPFVLYSCYRFIEAGSLWQLSTEEAMFLEQRGCFHLPARPALDDFVKQYFLNIHPLLPILDEGEFWTLLFPCPSCVGLDSVQYKKLGSNSMPEQRPECRRNNESANCTAFIQLLADQERYYNKRNLVQMTCSLSELAVILRGCLAILFPQGSIEANSPPPKGIEHELQTCLDKLIAWYQSAGIEFDSPSPGSNVGQLPAIFSRMISMYYHTSRALIYHHMLGHTITDAMGTTDVGESHIQSRLMLDDALDEIGKDLAELARLDLIGNLPDHFVTLLAFPYAWRVFDAKAVNIESHRRESIRAALTTYNEAMWKFLGISENTKSTLQCIEKILNRVKQMELCERRRYASNIYDTLGSDPLLVGGLAQLDHLPPSDSFWADLVEIQPQTYLQSANLESFA